MEHSIGKRIGEFLILGLYLTVDATHIWPHSHFFALLTAVIGLVALLLLDGGFSRKQILIFASVAIAGGVAVYFAAPTTAAPEVEVSGSLIPGNEPTPANACDGNQLPADAMRILIGDNATVRTKLGKFTAVQIGRCPVLSMERTGDKISVSADLYDPMGKLIATTKNGEVHAITGENVQMRRAGDLSTLIIEDGGGKELLYVRYLNPTTVTARGIFSCPGHRTFALQDNRKIPGSPLSENCSTDAGIFVRLD